MQIIFQIAEFGCLNNTKTKQSLIGKQEVKLASTNSMTRLYLYTINANQKRSEAQLRKQTKNHLKRYTHSMRTRTYPIPRFNNELELIQQSSSGNLAWKRRWRSVFFLRMAVALYKSNPNTEILFPKIHKFMSDENCRW